MRDRLDVGGIPSNSSYWRVSRLVQVAGLGGQVMLSLGTVELEMPRRELDVNLKLR